jgi:hypothetical protein
LNHSRYLCSEPGPKQKLRKQKAEMAKVEELKSLGVEAARKDAKQKTERLKR